MAEVCISVYLDEFSCSICLDLLNDPVTIPCGHSYCRVCIKGHWDQDDQKLIYSCPQCRQTFTPRPVLSRNNMLTEVVGKLKKTGQEVSPSLPYVGPGDVPCDICTDKRHRAVKSCLVCLASYCETHIQPHYESTVLKKHSLCKASTQLKEKICPHHDKLLEVYCCTDQQCICYQCAIDQHRGHEIVVAQAERTKKQEQVKKVQMECQQKIKERETVMLDLQNVMGSVKCSAQEAVVDSERTFNELIRFIERRSSEVREIIKAKERDMVCETEGLLETLEKDNVELRKIDANIILLTQTEDHIHFLQSCKSLVAPLGFEDIPRIPVGHQVYFEKVKMFTSTLKDKLEDVCTEELVKVSKTDITGNFVSEESVERNLGLKETMQAEDPQMQKLFVPMCHILDRLTPKNFQQLMVVVTELTIDTDNKLKGIVDLIHERAIAHPASSVVYANLCRCLMGLKVPKSYNPRVTVNFRNYLLNRCQREFENDTSELFGGKQKELDTATKGEVSQRLKEEPEEAKAMWCRRSLGNIRFICELFKLKMLTESIVHTCIIKLSNDGDDNSLECLCTMLSTIGKDLDVEKARPRMNQYYRNIETIVKNRTTSPRIRYMLQDVLDLRKLHL
ncbi:E3 ubiquitin-protein ligase TRIM47 [Coregonus clupeaformis]|uniref:E3 ubiquitin/ISG15 ligase TRIM25-like n=1 Tax=Coregonus suidteri TaxID=861788 RepID=A0AAN8L9I9_9TELE|nr:E3 ubiquitin-protein ligase TRIM47 [Coregonus clupeaformis]